jgi:hypothetical protein
MAKKDEFNIGSGIAPLGNAKEVANRMVQASYVTPPPADASTSGGMYGAAGAKFAEAGQDYDKGMRMRALGKAAVGGAAGATGFLAQGLEGANKAGQATVGEFMRGLGFGGPSTPGPSKGQILPVPSIDAQITNAAMAKPEVAGSLRSGPKGPAEPAGMPGMDAAFAARGQKNSALRQVAQSPQGITNADVAKYGPAGGFSSTAVGADLAAYNRNLDLQRHENRLLQDERGRLNRANVADAELAWRRADGKKATERALERLLEARRQAGANDGSRDAINKQASEMTATQIRAAQEEKINTPYQQLSDQRKFDAIAANPNAGPSERAMLKARIEREARKEKVLYETEDESGNSTKIAGTVGGVQGSGLQLGQAPAGSPAASAQAQIKARQDIDGIATAWRKSGDKSPEGRAAIIKQLADMSALYMADPAFAKWFESATKDFK